MELTMWIEDTTGNRLNEAELTVARGRARHLYLANTHIFEDEAEALVALGVVRMLGSESGARYVARAA